MLFKIAQSNKRSHHIIKDKEDKIIKRGRTTYRHASILESNSKYRFIFIIDKNNMNKDMVIMKCDNSITMRMLVLSYIQRIFDN